MSDKRPETTQEAFERLEEAAREMVRAIAKAYEPVVKALISFGRRK